MHQNMSPSRFPLLSSPLHPPVRRTFRRPEASSSKAALMSLQKPLLYTLAVILLILSTAFLSQARPSSASTTTTQPQQQQQQQQQQQHQNPQENDSQNICIAHDQPNPLAATFPNNATGVLNATLAIIPIPLSLARQLIPSQYSILESAYRSLVPDFPEGMYPVLLQAAHDHDIQLRAYGFVLEDFSRIGFEFPFLSPSGDGYGYSSYRWAPAQLISAGNGIAIDGSRAYGTRVSPASFEPECEAYKVLSNGNTYFKGVSTAFAFGTNSSVVHDDAGLKSKDEKLIELEMTRLVSSSSFESDSGSPYSLDFFKNITNQPTFASPGGTCDNMIRFFDTAMSRGQFAPVPVRGRVKAVNVFPFVEGGMDSDSSGSDSDEASRGQRKWEWADVYGVQVATPFIENNYLDCEVMRGYKGWTAPDGMMIDDL